MESGRKSFGIFLSLRFLFSSDNPPFNKEFSNLFTSGSVLTLPSFSRNFSSRIFSVDYQNKSLFIPSFSKLELLKSHINVFVHFFPHLSPVYPTIPPFLKTLLIFHSRTSFRSLPVNRQGCSDLVPSLIGRTELKTLSPRDEH